MLCGGQSKTLNVKKKKSLTQFTLRKLRLIATKIHMHVSTCAHFKFINSLQKYFQLLIWAKKRLTLVVIGCSFLTLSHVQLFLYSTRLWGGEKS